MPQMPSSNGVVVPRWVIGATRKASSVRLGPRARPGGLGMHNARNGPCPNPKRALPLDAYQCKLGRTACDRSGTRRVFRARRGDAVPSCWGIAARGGPPPKGAHELRRLRVWLELRRHP